MANKSYWHRPGGALIRGGAKKGKKVNLDFKLTSKLTFKLTSKLTF